MLRMNKGRVKVDEREKRDVSGQPVPAGTRKMAVKADEVQLGCRGMSRTRMSDRQRSSSWDFDNKPLATLRSRAVLRDVEPPARRSAPRASSVNSKRPGSVAAAEKSILARAASPASNLGASMRRSPALQIYRDEALSRTTTTSSNGKSSTTRPRKISSSPLETGIGRRRSGDVVKASPLGVKASPVVHAATRKPSNLMRLSTKSEEDQGEALSSIQSSLHGRLSMLEGRVSQMAAELRETKELLDASNPISSKVLLTDIQSKINNIERCMTGSPGASRPGRLSSGRTSSDTAASLRERILMEKEGFKKALQSLTASQDSELASVQRSSSRRYSKDSPALEKSVKSHYERQTRLSNSSTNHSRLDILSNDHAQPISEAYYSENPIQNGQPARSRPSLHQTLVETRASLNDDRDPLLGGRERVDITVACDEGALMASEFLTSLNTDRCYRKEVGKSLETLKVPLPLIERKSSLPLPDCSDHSSSSGSILSSRKHHRYSDEASDTSSSEYSSPSLYQSTGDVAENQRSTIGEFADIDHLKLSDGSHLSKQVTKADFRTQPIQASRSSSETFTVSDLRCDESVLLDEEDGGFCVSSPTAKDEEEESSSKQLLKLGERSATAGWFVCESEGILLAHEDGCCSYYDVANMEEKSVYRGPSNVASRGWGDCWIVRAPGTDGRSSKFVVAATAGGATDASFCSWDFYSRRTAAYHCEPSYIPSPPKRRNGRSYSQDLEAKEPSGAGLRKWLDRSGTFSMSKFGGNGASRKTFERSMSLDQSIRKRNVAEELEIKPSSPPLWWYRPCAPLLASAASGLKTVSLFDIRDGDSVMHWDTQKPVAAMAYSCPLQWRNKGKLVLAERESLTFWDVESLEAKRLQTVNLLDKQLRALHVYNVDAECSGGVRQRLSSSDHHSDGILCTNEAMNVLDFRVPAGIAKKFPTLGEETHSIFADGDGVYTGATSYKTRLQGDGISKVAQPQCRLNQWSIRQGKLMNVYSFPQSNSHASRLPITQVWGTSETIMASNGNGLFVFEPARRQSSGQDIASVRDVLGSDDLESPTFDYASSRILLVSRDRPATWCHWP